MLPQLLLAALLSSPAAPVAPAPRAAAAVDRSLSETDRLRELEIDIRSALRRGEIDSAAAGRFQLAAARIRRQMVRMGIQVGYRQRIRMRKRIDALRSRLAQIRVPGGA